MWSGGFGQRWTKLQPIADEPSSDDGQYVTGVRFRYPAIGFKILLGNENGEKYYTYVIEALFFISTQKVLLYYKFSTVYLTEELDDTLRPLCRDTSQSASRSVRGSGDHVSREQLGISHRPPSLSPPPLRAVPGPGQPRNPPGRAISPLTHSVRRRRGAGPGSGGCSAERASFLETEMCLHH